MSRVAVLSDIHANVHALDAVLHDAQDQGVLDYWCLGDVTGYGAHPLQCLRRLRVLGTHLRAVVRGNHDAHLVGGCELGAEVAYVSYPSHAAFSLEYHLELLRGAAPDLVEWLAAWPSLVHESEGLVLLHGGVGGEGAHPELQYVTSHRECESLVNVIRRTFEPRPRLVFLGHTHVAHWWSCCLSKRTVEQSRWRPESGASVEAVEGRCLVVNPGSVGQPRDGGPIQDAQERTKASYAILDRTTWKVTFRRVSYNVKAAADAIRAAGLPEGLATRLEEGK